MNDSSSWTFFSNHAHVLICLARNGDQPLREVAVSVGITERAVQRIVSELEYGGYLEREKIGRQNIYTLNIQKPLRHKLESHRSIGDVLKILTAE